jgi:sugar phosphate isomerase/epimerase
MARQVLVCSGPWSDVPLEQFAQHAADWGYQGLDLAFWGDHFAVQVALGEESYCGDKLALFNQLDLTVPVVSVHRLSQAISDQIDSRHRHLVPEYVWGDGKGEGVRERATEELLAAFQAAQQLGVSVVSGCTGSPAWPAAVGCMPAPTQFIEESFRLFVKQWTPILERCQELGLKYACQVAPGQMAFDMYSAEQVLEELDNHDSFGFTLDPAQLHWQGVDPVEFIRRFTDRVFHVHVTDIAIRLNGRASLLNSGLPPGDPRRGWDHRSPGRGVVDWEGIIRALNEIGYDGPLAVNWCDPAMDRHAGAEEACKFVKRLDFEPAPREDPGFEDS